MSPWIWYTFTQKIPIPISEFWFKNLEHKELGTISALDLIIRVGNNLWSVATRGIGGIIFPFSISRTFLNMTTIMKIPFLYPLFQFIFSSIAIFGFFYSFQNAGHRMHDAKLGLSGFRLLHLYIIFYICIVLIWPSPPHRSLVTLTPFIFYYFIYGVQQLCCCSQNPVDMQNHRFCTPKLYFYVFIGLIITSSLKRDIGYIYDVHKYGHEGGKEAGFVWKEKEHLYKWIRENTPADAVFVTLYDIQLHLYTGRRTIRKLDSIDIILKADYVVLVPYGSIYVPGRDLSLHYFLPILEKYPQKFELVYHTIHTFIYKIVK
ncbi:MAG: hypothetical protein QMD71_05190 [bacterium]|nr:hypothetical protein [bacterium]